MNLTIRQGEQQQLDCGWMRRDTVYCDGVRLVGFIQTRVRKGRTHVHTVYGKHTVKGAQPEWLAKKNGKGA